MFDIWTMIWTAVAVGAIVFLAFNWTIFVFLYTFFVRIFVHNPPFVDRKKYFPYSKILEENWKDIRDELLALRHSQIEIPQFHELDKHQSRLSKGGTSKWMTYLFLGYGSWVDDNCARCPKTTALLKAEPRITSALFSILEPGKRLPRHFGPFKGVWRYHLGLKVPEGGACYIVVGGQRYSWKDAEGSLFDDSFLHFAANETDGERAVLFIDVLRDDFPPWLDRLNHWVYSVLRGSRHAINAVKKARDAAAQSQPQH